MNAEDGKVKKMALNRAGDGMGAVRSLLSAQDEYVGGKLTWKWLEGSKLQMIDFPECCHLSLSTNGTLVKILFRILHPSNNDCFESHPHHNSTKSRRAFQTASKTWRFFQAPRSRPTLGIVHIQQHLRL